MIRQTTCAAATALRRSGPGAFVGAAFACACILPFARAQCCHAGEGVEKRAVGLDAASPEIRAEASKSLVADGPEALRILVRFMRQHLADKDETAWKAAYGAIAKIVEIHAEDPRLDDALLKVDPPDTKNGNFGGIDFVWIPEGWFVAGTAFDVSELGGLPLHLGGEIRRAWLLFMRQFSRPSDHGGDVVPAVCGRSSTRPCRC